MGDLLRGIEKVFKEGYFSFRCSKHVSTTHEITWMELAKKLGTVMADLAQEEDAWAIERAGFQALKAAMQVDIEALVAHM